MALRAATLEPESADCDDDGWEAFEEQRCQRRTRRRRLRSSAPVCDIDSTPANRGADGRLLFGGYAFHGVGAALLLVGLLILAAAYFGGGLGGPAGDFAYRPAAALERSHDADRFGDHRDWDEGYADYVSRYAGADLTPDRIGDRGPWISDTMGWTTGGILLVFGVVVLGLALGRSAFGGLSDD